jgi:hypothetical protein
VASIGCGGNDDPAGEASANGEASTTPEAATPQAAFEAYKGAILAKDFQTELELLTPESQNQKLANVLSSAVARAGRNPDVARLLKKHEIGLGQLGVEATAAPGDVVVSPEKIQALAAAVKDKPTCYAELSRQMEQAEGQATGGPDTQNGPASGDAPKIELVNVKIDGDTASAEQRYNDLPVPIEFRKIDGRWYVQLVD